MVSSFKIKGFFLFSIKCYFAIFLGGGGVAGIAFTPLNAMGWEMGGMRMYDGKDTKNKNKIKYNDYLKKCEIKCALG